MKYTKTAVAVAIAGIAAAPMIASADTTLSGAIEINVNGFSGDKAGIDQEEAGPGDPTVGNGDVIVGVTAEHELNSGLIGYGGLRLDLDQLSNEGNNVSTDAINVGVKGGFGDVRIGEIPLAVEYGQVANDIYDIGPEISGGLSYTGDFGPVGVILNYSPQNNQDAVGVGAKVSFGGFTLGVGGEQRGESIGGTTVDVTRAAVGATFALGGASVAAHYTLTDTDVDAVPDVNIAAVQVGYGFGGVSAKFTYQVEMVDDDNIDDASAARLDLGYGLGGGMTVSTRFTVYDEPDSRDLRDGTEWRVQLAKSF